MKTLFFAFVVFLMMTVSCPADLDETEGTFGSIGLIQWQEVNPSDVAGKASGKKITSVEAFLKAMTNAPDDSMATLISLCGLPDAEYNPARSTTQSHPQILIYDGGMIFRYNFPNKEHLYIWTGKQRRINEAWLWRSDNSEHWSCWKK